MGKLFILHSLITRLVVKNYRSLLDVDIALAPLTVFVGKNGVGKSNLIDVLGILAALYQERYPSPLAIETPEKDIYSRELAVSSDVLQEAAFSYQVLVTTHSPDLINELPADFFLVVEKEDGITKIGPIISEQKEALDQQLFTLGELMQIEGLYREGASLRAKV
jgi:predicted ATPase